MEVSCCTYLGSIILVIDFFLMPFSLPSKLTFLYIWASWYRGHMRTRILFWNFMWRFLNILYSTRVFFTLHARWGFIFQKVTYSEPAFLNAVHVQTPSIHVYHSSLLDREYHKNIYIAFLLKLLLCTQWFNNQYKNCKTKINCISSMIRKRRWQLTFSRVSR